MQKQKDTTQRTQAQQRLLVSIAETQRRQQSMCLPLNWMTSIAIINGPKAWSEATEMYLVQTTAACRGSACILLVLARNIFFVGHFLLRNPRRWLPPFRHLRLATHWKSKPIESRNKLLLYVKRLWRASFPPNHHKSGIGLRKVKTLILSVCFFHFSPQFFFRIKFSKIILTMDYFLKTIHL